VAAESGISPHTISQFAKKTLWFFSLLVINSLKLQKHKFIEIVAIIQSKYLNPFYVYGPSPLFSVIFIISSPMLKHPVLISILCPYI